MEIKKFSISNDRGIYEAFPDVVLTTGGKLICVFAECTHHSDRDYTRIMICRSTDRGRTWSRKTALSESTKGLAYFLNCPRIQQLDDGRLVVVVDRIPGKIGEDESRTKSVIVLYFSSDDGTTWSEPVETPARGIVPDKICVTQTGRWLLGCHFNDLDFGHLVQRLWYSDDRGKSWKGPIIVGKKKGLSLCEVSILPVKDKLVAFLRENSFTGLDCFKTVSGDDGATWSDPVKFPMPGCHRPVAGYLNDGQLFITYRFMQGGKGWLGHWTQNLFAAVTDDESALAEKREDAWTRIIPIDHDPSEISDLGYSGWVQFDDGEIYIVNYIVDDAEKAQIRGYSLTLKKVKDTP